MTSIPIKARTRTGRVVDAKGLFRRTVQIELLRFNLPGEDEVPRLLEVPDRKLQIGDWVEVLWDFSGKIHVTKKEHTHGKGS